MQRVLLGWQAGTLSGWGVLGLNLFEHWAAGADIQPLMGVPLDVRAFPGTSPLRYLAMRTAAEASNEFLQALTNGLLDLRHQGVMTIDPFGNGLIPSVENTRKKGIYNVARCIFESTRIDSTAAIEPYDSLLCASRWAADILGAVSDKPVAMIHEGIDHSIFFPGPRSGMLDPNCFYVFAGGKVEFRKAQDLVILAFREFAARHEDAVLVTAWHSPWAGSGAGYQGKLAKALRQDTSGALQIRRWAIENGIKPHQIVELPLTANSLMAQVLREMDCSLQVSRCEACTNLPAKEAMACGVPVILANNTGTRDLVDTDNCIALVSQDPVAPLQGEGADGWGESRVDEIVAALEMLYTDTQKRKRMGMRGAQWILEHRRTWRDHADLLKEKLLSLV